MIISTVIAATVAAAEPVPAPQPAAAPAPATDKKMACCEKMKTGEGCDCCKDMGKKAAEPAHDEHGDHQ